VCLALQEDTTTKAYAEVWGTDSSGYEYAPVAWVQSMVDPYKNAAGETVITLELHEDWLHKVRPRFLFTRLLVHLSYR
jgi:hypothetical protein